MPIQKKKTTAPRKAKVTKATTASRKRKTPPKDQPAHKRQELSRPLGLEGWENLDPVILAALASEEPLLLVGRHGTAKSFLLERLARALELEFRFYNASLVNYDDLVGFPIPDEANSSLKYIGTPSSIWEAEVVFLDEINRTRPELQNKLFPIIHERRVQGLPLEKLRYRWAAMNPPPDAGEDDDETYLGAEPLDPALADRFAFILPVPPWQSLNNTARRRILQDQYSGTHPFTVSPDHLVEKARRAYLALQTSPPLELAEYVVAIEKSYRHNKGYLSARRLTILHRNILAIHAARTAIEGHPPARLKSQSRPDGDWEESAHLALLYSLPATVHDGKIPRGDLLALHKQAWELCQLDDDDAWKQVLSTPDPVNRLVLAHGLREKMEDFDLGKVILEAVSSQEAGGQRTAVALAAYLAFSRERDIPATVVETLAKEIERILDPVNTTARTYPKDSAVFSQIARELVTLELKVKAGKADPVFVAYVRNLLYDNPRTDVDPRGIHKLFGRLWDRLDLGNVVLEQPENLAK